jgi:DNA-binding NtrC family response regulator
MANQYGRPPGSGMKDPVSLGSELNIEGIRTEADIVGLWTKHVLALCDGNKKVAARVLGIDRRSLYRRLEKLEVKGDPDALGD